MNQAFWNLWSSDHVANCSRWQRLPSPAIPPSGAGWKKTWTANPELMQFGDQLLLYYRGTGVAEDDTQERDQIGAAEVVQIGRRGIVIDDLADGPVIRSGGPAAFDVEVLDPSAIAFKDEILLYYSAIGQHEDSIGLASSADGISFNKFGRIMAGRAPAVTLRNGKVWMLSQEMIDDGYGLKLFVSSDGRSFQQAYDQPVFSPETGAWDSLSVVTARLFDDGEYVYMLYGGSTDKVDEPSHFGLARSKDLVQWERHPGNPIFAAGPAGAPDGASIWFPALTETAEAFVMLYEGGKGTPGSDFVSAICQAFVLK